MRMFSVLWAGVYLCSWFLFVRALSRSETLALFITSVVAFDYSCLAAASDGRMEMMCAALGPSCPSHLCEPPRSEPERSSFHSWNLGVCLILLPSHGRSHKRFYPGARRL